MNIYYEIGKSIADLYYDGCTNFVQHNVEIRNNGTEIRYNFKAMRFANRVWSESEQGIQYIKYRFEYPVPEVDTNEFLWVKLKSKSIGF